MLLGPRHGDVEEPALLLDLLAVVQVLVRGEAAVHQPDHEHRVPLEPLGGVDGGECQEPLLDVRRQHVAHAVRRGLERHVGEQRGEAPVAPGDGDEVLQVLLALGEVLGVEVAEHGRVEADHLGDLLAGGQGVGGELAQERGQVAELLRVRAAARVGREALGRARHVRRGGEVREDVLGGARPDVLEEEQHAMPRHRVARVGDHPEVGQHILHVRRLDELEAAPFDERDIGALELELQVEGVEARAEEDGHLVEWHALLAQLEDALGDEARLRLLVAALHQQRRWAVAPPRAQHLGVLLRGAVDDRVGEVEDGLRRAVVLLELDDSGVGKGLREVHDVAEGGAAKGIDALAVVTDRHHVRVRGGEAAHDLGLERVRVLVLVHHDEAVGARELGRDLRLVAQQVAQEDEEVVVVDQVLLALVARVLEAEALQVLEVLREVEVALRDDVVERLRAVDGHAQDLEDRALAREAAVLPVEPRPAAQQVHHVLGVAAVEDGEVGLEPDVPRRAPEHHVGEGVERPARDALAAGTPQRRGAPEHLLGRPAREGEEEDLPRVDARLDQARDPVDERARLAAASAGDHQHRALQGGRGLVLCPVQLARVVDAVAVVGPGVRPRAKRVRLHRASCGARTVPCGVGGGKKGTACGRAPSEYSAPMH